VFGKISTTMMNWPAADSNSAAPVLVPVLREAPGENELVMGWRGAEAWIFLSVGDSAEPGELAALDTVISLADSNNHSVPTVPEFEQAISQLLGASLVTVMDKKFGLTTSGQRLFDSINSVKRGHIVRYLAIRKEWRVAAPIEAQPIPWTIDPAEFHRATGLPSTPPNRPES
jgi:hypothetical protein